MCALRVCVCVYARVYACMHVVCTRIHVNVHICTCKSMYKLTLYQMNGIFGRADVHYIAFKIQEY